MNDGSDPPPVTYMVADLLSSVNARTMQSDATSKMTLHLAFAFSLLPRLRARTHFVGHDSTAAVAANLVAPHRVFVSFRVRGIEMVATAIGAFNSERRVGILIVCIDHAFHLRSRTSAAVIRLR